MKETSIGETYFFREEAGFAFVERRVRSLHRLRSKHGGRPFVRMWSAGCASGEEAYSLAIVALEAVGEDLDIEVVGTDLNVASLVRAEAATYGAWSFRGVSEARKARWFESVGADAWRPIEEVRRRVQFSRLNLAQDSAAMNHWGGSFDLILCRNVLLYFSHRQLPAVTRRFASALAPGGRLILGATDPSLSSPSVARTAQVPPIYRRAEEVRQKRSPSTEPVLRRGDSSESDASGRRGDGGDDVRDSAVPETATAARPPVAVAVAVAVARPRLPAPPPAPPLPSVPAIASSTTAGPGSVAAGASAVTDTFARARSLADGGAYAEAAGLLDEALVASPLDPSLHLLRGMVALSAGDAAQALRRADAALLLDSSLGMAHLLAAMASAKERDTDRARRSARNALAAIVQGEDPPRYASESKADLERACRALLRGATGVDRSKRVARDGKPR